MSEVTWTIIQKDKFFVGVALSSKGVYGNTIPYSSRDMVQEKIAKYFSESRIVDTYESKELNNLAEDVAGLILQRWLGRDYNLSYEIPIDFTGYSQNQIRVLETCGQVPYGTTLSYGELASKAGFQGAARFAGTCMAKTRFPIIFPCHRITRANSLGKYGDDPDTKRRILEREGVDTTTLFRKKRRIKTPL
ncbi:MAG: methylated-DNA--[protein]-cysteine S-methyltransferase [Candidatus Kariarchaeaceae archaeon]|jgi:O-6-methylguanine DNA methyltransferase